jgi:tetratricopeptide (TPR) repeat protein
VPEPTPATDLEARKTLGRAHLNANRLQEALEIFAGILRAHPDDVETRLLLGDWYLASGDAGTAGELYRRAQELAPDQADIARRLRLAQAELALAPSTQAESNATDAAALARLLERLTRRPVISEAEVSKAAAVLDEIVSHSSPARAVAERLDEIDALLPALLELRIRQARADGRADLAETLQRLLDDIQQQMHAQESAPAEAGQPPSAGSPEPVPSSAVTPAAVARKPSVLFVGAPSSEAAVRQALPAEALRALGCETAVSADFASQAYRQFDVVVIRLPQAEPELADGLVACVAFGARAILDLEADFEQLPPDHPDYARLGLGTARQAKAYQAALRTAHLVCVQSAALAHKLRAAGHTAQVMPPGWSRSNPLWAKASPSHDTLNVGWAGAPGQLDDVAEIRGPVMRLLREFHQTRLVTGGDPQVYELFKTLPQERRQFLPPARYDDFPNLLSQIDVLLVPLRSTPYNQSLSDLRLLEAGVRGIPWVASPLPIFEAWGEGGLLASTPDEWYACLRQLIVDAAERKALGEAGRRQAEEREMGRLAPAWLEMIERVRAGSSGHA